MRLFTALFIGATIFALAACKGHSSAGASSSAASTNTLATAANNVAPIVVNAGPGPTANVNTLYTSVTICAPGSTTNCQTIDNIAVDTGAAGLRIIASVLSPTLAAALPLAVDGNGNNIVECTQYAIGYAWGPVATADVTISGESAASLPIQIIGSTQFPTPPPDTCAGTGVLQDTVASFGANGTIGISVFTQDCGSDCALSLDTSINPGFYYACASANSCSLTTVPLASQVPNPITLFATDNNGVIIEMQNVAATGASSVAGVLVFGVDTQTNNASLPSSGTLPTVLTVDPVHGYLSASLNGVAYPQSFFDTGSNALYFNDASTSPGVTAPPITLCSDQANSGFYCPSSTTGYAATVLSTDNVAISVQFSIANTDDLRSSASLVAFNDLAGTFSVSGVFDWGLPFFFGRNVYSVIEGKATTVGTGPYVAF